MLDDKPTYPNLEASGKPLESPVSQATVEAARGYRLGRLRAELARHDAAAILLYDPINIRYATDATNMQVWTMHNPARYALVFCDGPVILFEFHSSTHLAAGLATIDEVRGATSWFYFNDGPRVDEQARKWADEIAALLRRHGAGSRRLAVDKCEPAGIAHLRAHGLEIVEGQQITELARCIKSDDELELMAWTIKVCESGMWRMHSAARDGATENEVWAELHHENIRNGGEWIETRLLSSGPRTNPWMQESGPRVMRRGEIIAFDTDLIGPYGYCADLSRTWTVDHVPPGGGQRELYRAAREQIETNLALIRAGMTTREFAERSWPIPDKYKANRYTCLFHGVGLCDEYPRSSCLEDFDASGYDVPLEENMVVCIESLIGEVGGPESVKLEVQVVLTETGCRRLDSFPLEDW